MITRNGYTGDWTCCCKLHWLMIRQQIPGWPTLDCHRTWMNLGTWAQRFLPSFYIILHHCLVVSNMKFWLSHSVGNVIIPTDELIFFRGLGIPPTSFGIGFQGFSHGKPDGLGKLQHSEPSFRGGFGLVCSSPARLGDSAIPGTRWILKL